MKKGAFFLMIFCITITGWLTSCKKNNQGTATADTTTVAKVAVTPPFVDPHLWTAVNSNSTDQIIDIQFTSADTGFVFGYGTGDFAFISRTTDGGMNWNLVKQFDSHYPNFMCFYPGTSKDIMAARDNIYASHDAGSSFTYVANQTNAFIGSVIALKYFDSLTGIAIGNANIYRTTDNQNWTLVHTDNNGVGYEIIDFPDNNNGYIAGGFQWESAQPVAVAPSYGIIAKTTDGGKTWQDLEAGHSPNPPTPFGEIVGLSFIDSQNGFIATIDGKLLHTTDGGATWATVNSKFVGSNIVFVSSQIGYCISGYSIYGTTDGGVTFTQEYQSAQGFYSIRLNKNNKVFVTGNNGVILVRK